jgi:hypothetical protein
LASILERIYCQSGVGDTSQDFFLKMFDGDGIEAAEEQCKLVGKITV